MKKLQTRRMVMVLLCIVLITKTLCAQGKKPSWTEKEPIRKNSYIGIVQVAKPNLADTATYSTENKMAEDSLTTSDAINYKEKAALDALKKIAAQMPWETQNGQSLYATLASKELYDSTRLETVLMTEIRNNLVFEKVGEWENDTAYWGYFAVTKNDAKNFIKTLIDSTVVKAKAILDEGKQLQSTGNLYRAANKYVDALEALHPIIFIHTPIQNAEGNDIDLGLHIYESYLNVYKGITLSTEVKQMPGVTGEKIPGKYAIRIMQNNIPLRNIGVKAQYDGAFTIDPSTNDMGIVNFSIDEVSPMDENNKIIINIDNEQLMSLPPVYGHSSVSADFPSIEIPIHLFNPQAYTIIETAESDSILKKALVNIWNNNRDDFAFVGTRDSADIIVNIGVDIAKLTEFTGGKYQFIQHNTALHIEVKGVADDVVISEYDIKDFSLVLPASRTEAQIRQSALREMIRQMNRELPKYIKGYEFDKRELTWRTLLQVSCSE